MENIAKLLNAYITAHPFDPGDSNCKTVLDQLYQAYAESHESDPLETSEGFKELEEFLCSLPLEDNNVVFNLCCRLCSAYEHKAYRWAAVWFASYSRSLKVVNTAQDKP